MELRRRMGKLIRNSSDPNLQADWTDTFFCSREGLGDFSEWDVRGFYEDKFKDPLNFNLGENSVSLITAIATSFSLILFTDIMFRIAVRARNQNVSKEVVFRRHLINVFSNPINFLSLCVTSLQQRNTSTTNQAQNQEWNCNTLNRSSKRTFYVVVLIGLTTVLVDFVFIFLATNQNKRYDVKLDEIPVFEFEDRGCERVVSPVRDSCLQVPLTEKAGFDTRAALQICTSNTVEVACESRRLPNATFAIVGFATLNTDGVVITVLHQQIISTESVRIGVILGDGGFYQGILNVSSDALLSALSDRIQRTNATILDTSATTVDEVDFESGPADNSLTIGGDGISESVSVLLDVEHVNLMETHMSVSLDEDSTEADIMLAMIVYLFDVARSVMFPTGTGRGIGSLMYLDEVQTPLAYYNRPWLGALPSLVICGCLLIIWIVFAVKSIESDVDLRLAWKEFFNDTLAVSDFGRGSEESQVMHWRCDRSGNRSFGFAPRA